jgi:hypothetical protein
MKFLNSMCDKKINIKKIYKNYEIMKFILEFRSL